MKFDQELKSENSTEQSSVNESETTGDNGASEIFYEDIEN